MKPNILELVDVGFHSSTQPTHFLILDFIKSSMLNSQSLNNKKLLIRRDKSRFLTFMAICVHHDLRHV
jgi:hypothetical protein